MLQKICARSGLSAFLALLLCSDVLGEEIVKSYTATLQHRPRASRAVTRFLQLISGRSDDIQIANLPIFILPTWEAFQTGVQYERAGYQPPAPPVSPAPPVHAAPLPVNPVVKPTASSAKLLEQFHAQVPSAPGSPPVLLSESDASERALLSDDGSDESSEGEGSAARAARALPALNLLAQQLQGVTAQSPPRPYFDRPLKLRGRLTVPRADYSESYTAWWDPGSGDARVHFHSGAAGTFRKVLADGRVQRVEMHVERWGARSTRRCAVSVSATSRAPLAHPALPNVERFHFVGYEQREGRLVERWQLTVRTRGRRGEEQGEELSTLHQLLLTRGDDGRTRPLSYKVAVNSSILGADCDGYEHFYIDARSHRREPEFYEPNLNDLCDEVVQLDATLADDLTRLEPLREFTMLHRDPRYDVHLKRFKTQYQREYADNTEEAIRKNLLMQSSRFVSSGNRMGGTFELALGFLADRLNSEAAALAGVRPAASRRPSERPPHSRPALATLRDRLPDSFDWRTTGAVSPVRFQGTNCSSCWAFAVAGAVEGALFVRTRRLVPLSEQSLVDCAHPYGGRGCGGTWPSHAYDYVKDRGLPALDEYTPYQEKVQQCKADVVPPVTRISAHVDVAPHSVEALQVAIGYHAPTVVIVDSWPKSFLLYKRGVYYDERCSKTSARHAMLAVGWGWLRGELYFLLKNSWSEVWGERGYMRVQARANTCGVLTRPSYPRLEIEDVLKYT